VPGICAGYGLAEGTEEEAFRSKFKYVMTRLQPLPAVEILRIARAVQSEEESADLDEALAKFDEQGDPQITPLTRQRILTEIDGVPMSGNLDEIEFLKKLWPIDQMNSPGFSLKETTMEDTEENNSVVAEREELESNLLRFAKRASATKANGYVSDAEQLLPGRNGNEARCITFQLNAAPRGHNVG
jgi:hypothetical protein